MRQALVQCYCATRDDLLIMVTGKPLAQEVAMSLNSFLLTLGIFCGGYVSNTLLDNAVEAKYFHLRASDSYKTDSPTDRAELDRLGAENVRLKLAYSGATPLSVVPGLGSEMLRGEVEDWLAEKYREANKLQHDILWWAKAAAWIAGIGILIGIAIGVLPLLLQSSH